MSNNDSVNMTPLGTKMTSLKNLYILDSVTRWSAEDIVNLLTDEERYLALQIVHDEITGSNQRLLQCWSNESSLLTISVPGIMDSHEAQALEETLLAVGHKLHCNVQRGNGSHMVLTVGIVFKHIRD